MAALVAPQAAWATGQQTFAAQFSMCHQTAGAGLPGQFPRLAGRVPQIASSPDGRRYLAMVLINGLYGPIIVDRKPINGMMPAVASLSDQAIADVLNHAMTFPGYARKVAPFAASEIAGVRASGRKSGNVVAAERSRLVAAKLIP
ncbi:cytochrome c [Novosphingobium sp. Chol11]|uniref:c-type cytochrome n=1 Tax=Novosphingobium sp. Chol11 TaxID=1385763 RepID=UPI0025D15057|nr:cytochrome c [Novosphingobium sp. Chol11]